MVKIYALITSAMEVEKFRSKITLVSAVSHDFQLVRRTLRILPFNSYLNLWKADRKSNSPHVGMHLVRIITIFTWRADGGEFQASF